MPLASIHEDLGVRGSNRHPWRGGEIWASRRSTGVIQGSPRSYLRKKPLSNERERALGDMPPPPSASSAADAGKPRAACCASARFCSPASSSRPERSRSSHADSNRRRQSHHQQTAGNYELVRDEDAESWRRSGSCPNKMGLAAAETSRSPSWFGLTHDLVLGGSP